jgi:hypothetical protein
MVDVRDDGDVADVMPKVGRGHGMAAGTIRRGPTTTYRNGLKAKP